MPGVCSTCWFAGGSGGDEDATHCGRCFCCPVSASCPVCPHPVNVHSREPGVGCLHDVHREADGSTWREQCPCLCPGTSDADQ